MLSKVTIPESLFEALLLHAFSDEANEIMGLLIGEIKSDEKASTDDEEIGKCQHVHKNNLFRICLTFVHPISVSAFPVHRAVLYSMTGNLLTEEQYDT